MPNTHVLSECQVSSPESVPKTDLNLESQTQNPGSLSSGEPGNAHKPEAHIFDPSITAQVGESRKSNTESQESDMGYDWDELKNLGHRE